MNFFIGLFVLVVVASITVWQSVRDRLLGASGFAIALVVLLIPERWLADRL